MTDPIIDLIIRIKNGYSARRESIASPHSKFRVEVLKKLQELKYIEGYDVKGDVKKTITVGLIYEKGTPAVTGVKLASRPGRRSYAGVKELKSVFGGMGVSLLSTPQGIMTNKEARKQNAGGELLFEIW